MHKVDIAHSEKKIHEKPLYMRVCVQLFVANEEKGKWGTNTKAKAKAKAKAKKQIRSTLPPPTPPPPC